MNRMRTQHVGVHDMRKLTVQRGMPANIANSRYAMCMGHGYGFYTPLGQQRNVLVAPSLPHHLVIYKSPKHKNHVRPKESQNFLNS